MKLGKECRVVPNVARFMKISEVSETQLFLQYFSFSEIQIKVRGETRRKIEL